MRPWEHCLPASNCLAATSEMVLVMVMDAPDEGALAGSGHAGPELSVQEFDDQVAQAREATNTATGTAQSELGLKNADIRILTGEPGVAICKLAAELSAEAIVVGNPGKRQAEACTPGLSLGSCRPQCSLYRRRDQELTHGQGRGLRGVVGRVGFARAEGLHLEERNVELASQPSAAVSRARPIPAAMTHDLGGVRNMDAEPQRYFLSDLTR